MRLPIRCVLLCLVAFGQGSPPTLAASSGPNPPQAPSAATLRAQANQAAARYAEARATYERLGDEVAGLERQVADIETRLDPLRLEVTRQAVAVYQGDVAADAVNHLEAIAAMLRSDRASHFVAEVSARHLPAIETLLAAKQRLRDRQADLEARRREQDATMANLTAQRQQISAQLDALGASALPPNSGRRPLPRAGRAGPGLGQRLRPPASFVCPIAGPLAFTDDFGAPRGGGRRHMGNDLLSPPGTPNVAVVDGTIETRPWAGGGITIFLRGVDGNTYVYMHLQRIEGEVPRRVSQGEVIGRTGNTGHSFGYHTHFEYHPDGGEAVSPYPLLSAACL